MSSRGPVTAQHDFCEATPDGDCLFSVRAGIPLGDAFEHLTMMLGQCIASVELAAGEQLDPDAVPGALCHSVNGLNFCYALATAMGNGLALHRHALQPNHQGT